jgi:putative isomerase
MIRNLSLFCTLGAALLSVGCRSVDQQTGSLRQQYDDIIDIAHTPAAGSRGGGWFCDQGSWRGFTVPESEKWVNGFCGPFDLDNRGWMARAAVSVSFDTPAAETFTPEHTNYIPGEISILARSATGAIAQRLQFVDASTALLGILTDTNRTLRLGGDGWREGTRFQLDRNTVIARLPGGEFVCIGFPPEVKVECGEDNYRALYDGQGEIFVTISFFNNEKDKLAKLQKAASILDAPGEYFAANDRRWDGYLEKVLRDDMPHEYNRIAVKSIVTLISNWKTHKGGLLHEGVIPSHAVSYFNGFWAWDSWRFSVALAPIAPELAKNNIRAMFDYQLPNGMIIDCIYSDPEENNARDSKPPLAAWAVDAVFESSRDTTFLREMYPGLLAYHRWWYAERDHDRNGICEFGSVDGTVEAAAWESGMDNAIRFDDAAMVRNDADDAWSFNRESVDLNAYLALEYGLLRKFAAIIGQPFEEPDRTANVAQYFFDDGIGFFFDRRLADGSFVREEGCEAYTPLWTGIATPGQVERAMAILTDTTKFSTYIPFPTVAADNPKFMPAGYWRGPIWLDQTYFAIKGLRNYGYNEMADAYTLQVFDRLDGLTGTKPIHENYDTHTGGRLKAPHFSWSAAHLLMLYGDYGKRTFTTF